jgi:type VI secretion system secreted protein VgrG
VYEHLTQFRETDLAFLSRLAAHAGIFYQFSQSSDGKDVILFGNDLEHYSRSNLHPIALREHAGLESVGTEAVTAFSIRHSPMLHSYAAAQLQRHGRQSTARWQCRVCRRGACRPWRGL